MQKAAKPSPSNERCVIKRSRVSRRLLPGGFKYEAQQFVIEINSATGAMYDM